MAIAVVGMLDEREEALSLIKERIEQQGHKALLVDISIGTGAIVPSLKADIGYGELSELGGGPSTGVAGYLPDRREEAISIMAKGLREKIMALHKSGDLQGMIAISGLTGAMISLPAMKEVPFGLPKLIISSAMAMPVHADKYAEFVCIKDITVMHAVVDTVGMNSLVRKLVLNGADAISGMVEGGVITGQEEKPSIAITEFGFTDMGAHYIREFLEKEYEIVSFHANGVGDRAAMEIIPQGSFQAFIDLVPGAFSEYLLGGNRGNYRTESPGYCLRTVDSLYPLPGRFRHNQLRPLRKERQQRYALGVKEACGEKIVYTGTPASAGQDECGRDGVYCILCRRTAESLPSQGKSKNNYSVAWFLFAERRRWAFVRSCIGQNVYRYTEEMPRS